MEGNFETSGGGSSGGSSMSGSGDIGELNSSGEIGGSNPTNSTGPSMNHLDYLKDGVDKGYYKSETEGMFSVEDVMNETQVEMEQDEDKKDWDIMDIPGTAHEKLEAFADGEEEVSEDATEETDGESEEKVEEEIEESVKGKKDTEKSVESDKNELTFEQQIIKLQAETMRLMAEAMNSKVNKKELEELLKKLKEMAGEADKDKSGSKATLLTGLFSAVLILLEAGEKGYKMVENEVKEAEK